MVTAQRLQELVEADEYLLVMATGEVGSQVRDELKYVRDLGLPVLIGLREGVDLPLDEFEGVTIAAMETYKAGDPHSIEECVEKLHKQTEAKQCQSEITK